MCTIFPGFSKGNFRSKEHEARDFVNLRFFVDGYHLTPDGIPVLVDAIHKAGALQEQTGPHLVLSDSSLLGFFAQDVRNSTPLMIIRTVWPLPYLLILKLYILMADLICPAQKFSYKP